MDKKIKELSQYLLLRWLEGSSTDKEKAKLFALLEQEPAGADWPEMVEELMEQEQPLADYQPKDYIGILQKILEKQEHEMSRVSIGKIFSWKKWVAAAAIVLLLGAGSYWVFVSGGGKETKIVQQNLASDITAPQLAKARITTSTGKMIYLDSVASGTILTQDGIELVKLADGNIIYSSNNQEIPRPSIYNTLTNPRGSSVIDMQLSDGSRVWLNAGSSITYPVAFTGAERNVSMTGEAYFEISHNAVMPFSVSKGSTVISVLGTHFNVNAYDDEAEMKVTLLEGSIKINNSVMIKPGQQAKIAADIKVLNGIDTTEVIAWKNGYFQFSNTSLSEILRQVERWYDVQIIYEKSAQNETFTGDIPRQENVSKLLAMLELTGTVHFQVKNNTIKVIQ